MWGFDSESISLTPLPMFHIGGIGWAYLGLVNGATTILVSEFDAGEVLDLLERERVTNAVFVPTILQMLAAVPGAAERDYSSLRSIAYGASPITTPVLRAALRTFRCPLFGVYGLTETTGGVVQLRPGGPRRRRRAPAPAALRRAPAALGRDAHRRPARRRRVRGRREVGEVWLRAPNVMAGYYGRDAETAAALTAGRVAAHRRRRLPRRGRLPVPHRPDQGHDRERRREHLPDRGRGGALAASRRRRGRGDRRARRALGRDRQGARRPSRRPGVDADELVAFARERLAGYKLPRSVEFVAELPRSPAGKVLKRELRARYARAAEPRCGGECASRKLTSSRPGRARRWGRRGRRRAA